MNAATDRVSGGMVQCRDKACYIWDEINKSEDEVMQDEITKETTQQVTMATHKPRVWIV